MATTKIGNKWQPICTTWPNELLWIDNWGPLSPSYLGYAYCLVGIDHFSKAVTVFPTIHINADVAIHFIQLAINMLGKYDKIMTDTSLYFTSKRFKKWCINNNVQLYMTTLAHSEANGCCQPFIRTFQQSLIKMGASSHNWHEFLTPTVKGYNSCPHSATGNTPAVGHFTPRSPDNPTWAKIVAHVQKARGRMIESDMKRPDQPGRQCICSSQN
jgi:transposase InsO family protein